ncbi:hypothetical protein BJX64DRAFT_300011 [Aspergillus heterothallicus]
MTNKDIRAKLNEMWISLTAPGVETHVGSSGCVPRSFLNQNNITLSGYEFSSFHTPGENLDKNPPVLFIMRDGNIVCEHPINTDHEMFTLPGAPEHDLSPATQVQKILNAEPSPGFDRLSCFMRYLDLWIFGEFPRVLLAGYPTLSAFCGIDCIADPHPLNVLTRGFSRSQPCYLRWDTLLHEYAARKPNGDKLHPHIILLGVQACNGYSNSISLGELTSIVTAMRCRAYQPVGSAYSEDAILTGEVEQSEDGNPAPDNENQLAFKDETKFPVLMVSLIGPEHVRLIYACMNGTNLSLRSSALYRLSPSEEIIWRNIAGALLSYIVLERT